jgi:hypothetical protein
MMALTPPAPGRQKRAEGIKLADHLDAPDLMPPGGNIAIDITDIYAFQKPGDSSKTILMQNVNPLATAAAFDSDALYDLLIDTDGDAIADIAFHVKFSPLSGGSQTATVRRIAGPDAPKKANIGEVLFSNAPVSFGMDPVVTDAGPYRFFAGLRSDPFFFDLQGFLENFDFTGTDFFADANVFGIVLEVPNSALGPNPAIGYWARTLVPDPGGLHQIERMGRPAINTVFMKGKDKNGFNRSEPSEDREQYLSNVIDVLLSFGHTLASATALAEFLLPDILTYSSDISLGFPNGRNLTDDVIDIELGLVSNGAVTSDGVEAHTDLLGVFPFLGNPHSG